MVIEILRIGQRLVRDDRVTTHVALVARAFGASKIYMNEVNPEIKDTLDKVNKTWGGNFEISFIDDWKKLVKERKNDSVRIVHLTMYGEDINDVEPKLEQEKDLLIVIGAEKVPRGIYDLADYNIAIGSQPHSEISALAVILDRISKGRKFSASFDNAQRKIIPTKQGKNVLVNKTRD
jgi:tRNA (cytidine56-2'-O)-methyltransferase